MNINRVSFILAILVIFMLPAGIVLAEEQPIDENLFDPELIKEIRLKLGKPIDGEVYLADLESIYSLVLSGNQNLNSLEGLQYLSNLTQLSINGINVTDISPIYSLHNLHILSLGDIHLAEPSVDDLRELTELTQLYLDYTNISDITFIEAMPHLEYLSIQHIQLTPESVEVLLALDQNIIVAFHNNGINVEDKLRLLNHSMSNQYVTFTNLFSTFHMTNSVRVQLLNDRETLLINIFNGTGTDEIIIEDFPAYVSFNNPEINVVEFRKINFVSGYTTIEATLNTTVEATDNLSISIQDGAFVQRVHDGEYMIRHFNSVIDVISINELETVNIADANLELMIRQMSGKYEGELTQEDLLKVEVLFIDSTVEDFNGIERLYNLRSMSVLYNDTLFEAIPQLPLFSSIFFANYNLYTIPTDLSGFGNLEYLGLSGNSFDSETDFSGLATLPMLRALAIEDNYIDNPSILDIARQNTSLKHLYLFNVPSTPIVMELIESLYYYDVNVEYEEGDFGDIWPITASINDDGTSLTINFKGDFPFETEADIRIVLNDFIRMYRFSYYDSFHKQIRDTHEVYFFDLVDYNINNKTITLSILPGVKSQDKVRLSVHIPGTEYNEIFFEVNHRSQVLDIGYFPIYEGKVMYYFPFDLDESSMHKLYLGQSEYEIQRHRTIPNAVLLDIADMEQILWDYYGEIIYEVVKATGERTTGFLHLDVMDIYMFGLMLKLEAHYTAGKIHELEEEYIILTEALNILDIIQLISTEENGMVLREDIIGLLHLIDSYYSEYPIQFDPGWLGETA